MYKHAETSSDRNSGRKKKLGASVGALVISAALLTLGSGVAYADDTNEEKAGTTVAEEPAVKDGVRTPADQGVVNESGTQGTVRDSMKAVPGTKGTTSLPDPMDTGWNCEFTWTKLCA